MTLVNKLIFYNLALNIVILAYPLSLKWSPHFPRLGLSTETTTKGLYILALLPFVLLCRGFRSASAVWVRVDDRTLHTYLARGLTVIRKAVPSGRGSSIALRLG